MTRFFQTLTLLVTGLTAGASRYLLFDGYQTNTFTTVLAVVAAVGLAAAVANVLLPLTEEWEDQ